MTKEMQLGQQIVYLTDYDEAADLLADSDGITDRYSFGETGLDRYFGGGYGKKNDYEIVLLFGDTGIGKSTFALNMLADPIRRGEKVGMLMLEDSGAAMNLKLRKIVGAEALRMNPPHFTPEDVINGAKLWGLDDLVKLIDNWFTTRELDVILLDHLQFAFESAVSLKSENEYIAQRIFVRKLNYIIRKHNKTIILVSHINKNSQAKGLGKIIGSGGISQSATKAIEVYRDKDVEGQMHVMMHKTRHTPMKFHDRVFSFDSSQRVTGWQSSVPGGAF